MPGPLYNMPAALLLRGRLEPAVLCRTLAGLTARHETLRTTFARRDLQTGQPVQVIAPPGTVEPDLPLVDLQALDEVRRDREVRRRAREEAERPFDLAAGPLLRAVLVRLAAEEHVVLFTLHHIIADGWSMGVLVREVAALYRAALLGSPADLPPLAVQFRDFAVWQRQWLTGDVLAAQLAWWRERLAGAPALLDLPADRPRPSVQRFRGDRRPLHLPGGLALGVRTLGRQAGATPFMTLLAAFQLLLSRLSGQKDVTVGSPIAGRGRSEVEGLIGFFVNTLALRLDRSGGSAAAGPAFVDILSEVRETTLDAYAHQDLPFERLVEELQPGRDLAYAPLFQVMFVLQNAPLSTLRLPGLDIAPFEVEVGIAKFDLTLSFAESAAGLSGGLAYNRDLFDPTTAERLAGHFRHLLAAALAEPGRAVEELPLLAACERHQLLSEWSGREREYPGSELLHELFAEQAASCPEEPAVWCAGRWMTYGELDSRSARLAARLRALGVGPESIVGLCLPRSFALIAGVLGILKAGGAYLALDPGLPAERLAFLIEDADVGALLIAETTAGLLPDGGVPRLWLAEDGTAEDGVPTAAISPISPISPDHPAYVIYTSGSTGKPKGVVIPHRAITARMLFSRAEDLGPGERMIQKTTLSFDVSVFEIFAPLLTGGLLVLPRPGGEGDPAYLLALAAEHGVTRLSFPPALLSLLLEQETLPALGALRAVTTGGETVPPDLPARFHSRMHAELENRYGPTEATISVTVWHCRPGETVARLPIGRPLPVAEILLLDPAFEPVPLGATGELCIGGVCLARGYLGRPELTAERFVPHPFAGSGRPGARLYRSGDFARQRTDGAIEFLGRIDGQVKVRGFRVELGEIEAALLEHPALQEAVVVDRADPATGSRRLVAWLVPRPGAARSQQEVAAEVQAFLRTRLPGYMVPTSFVPLAALPLTPSGKVDRQALPEPETVRPEGPEGDHEGPRGPFEELLAEIWSGLLGVRRVSRRDSFFDLGGHSLLATQLVSRVREALGVELPLRRIFEAPTLAGFALLVEAARSRGELPAVPPVRPVPRGTAALPLSFAQERLWFLDQLEPGSPAYVMPAAIRFSGRLDLPALAASLAEIVRRHESLRTTFGTVSGQLRQVVARSAPLALPAIDLADLPAARRSPEVERLARAEARRPFDLGRGPLLRVALLRLAEEEQVVLFTLHHIVSDGWSMGVLVRELGALYPAFAAGQPPPLPELPVQYADYALWQRGWLSGEILAGELAWWRRTLSGVPILELPVDRPRPALPSAAGGVVGAALPPELAAALGQLGRAHGVTPFMLLAAGFAALLSRYAGQDDVAVGSPIANRTRLETEGLIGFFVNTLVLRTDLSGNPLFADLLVQVRESTLAAHAHQDLPFERLVEEMAPERSLAHSPLFQVMFVFQEGVLGDLRLPGLTLRSLPIHSSVARFDLLLQATPGDGELRLALEYRRELFETTTALRLLAHLGNLLAGAAADPGLRLAALPLLSTAEREQVFRQWNDTGMAVLPTRVQAIFEAQAERQPGAPAVEMDGEVLPYAEVERRANRLARHLQALGVGAESAVGICLERSLALPVAVLAVLKAGGAYVALDPTYPAERLEGMAGDAGLAALVTATPLLDRLPPSLLRAGTPLVLLDRLAANVAGIAGIAGIAGEDAARPACPAHLDNLAYILYTSGSTGRPKGVAMPHRPLANMVAWQLRAAAPGLRTLQFASLAFDVSFQEMFTAWGSGGCLVLLADEVRRDAFALFRFLASERIERLFLPFVVLQGLAEAAAGTAETAETAENTALPPLKEVMAAGEQLQVTGPVRQLFARLPGSRLENHYGPSEAHAVTAFTLSAPAAGWPDLPPIGRPIPNHRVLLLDRLSPLPGEPVPPGVLGELYVGGAGLARGYLGRPDLTAERFLPDPWGGEAGARLYRTGDLARWRTTGILDYLGRVDQQVKVRGFRVEPGEVEAVLAAYPGVRAAAVLASRGKGAAGVRLVAYVVADGVSGGELRAFLAERLPDYMVPSAFVALAELPLTPSGKLDRRSLAQIEPAAERLPGGALVGTL